MKQSFKILSSHMLRAVNYVFPRHCFGCDLIHEPSNISNLCIFCSSQILAVSRTTFPNLVGLNIYSCGSYKNLLKRIMIMGKFKRNILCIEIMSEFLFHAFKQMNEPIDFITSVPSYYWRSLYRGVDLPAMLATELSGRIGIEYLPHLLTKTRRADRQSKMTKIERRKNVVGLFQSNVLVKDKTILVIDDILTTGSTAIACYKAFRRQKPRKIIFLTVAKT